MKVAAVIAACIALLLGAARASENPLLGPLDQAANALFTAAGVPNREATAVVPIVGSGGLRLGYAQITGPRSALRTVRAVLEVRSPASAGWSIAALIPVSSIAQGARVRRVYRVAVDALVNYGS